MGRREATLNAFRTELMSAEKEDCRNYQTNGRIAYGGDENVATAEKIEKSSLRTHHGRTADP